MKDKFIPLISLVMTLNFVISSAFAADGWKGAGGITTVEPIIYKKGDTEVAYPTFISTNIFSTDCGKNTWVIRSDIDDGGRMYAAVLAAFAAGHQVKLYQWSCFKFNGTYYPRVGGVMILK